MPDSAEDATPQPRAPFSALHDDDDQLPTPRMHPRHIVPLGGDSTRPPTATPAHAETPAARLRALLAREPRSPRDSTPVPPSAPSSDTDSAAEPLRFGSSTSSVTRESLKDIFSHALREPGDTPQKGRPRRNSFDGSSMEITPVVDRDRGQRRAARRSLSDEEAEKPKSDPSFRLSTAVTFDTLRARLMSSQSQLLDQNLPGASYGHSSLASTSTSHSQHPPQPSINSNRVTPVGALTPHPSFQMSSQLALQSNLLEQDSEMQRAMGDVLNSETEASTSAPNDLPSSSRPSSSLRRSRNGSQPEPRRTSYDLDSSTTSPSVNGRTDREHHPQDEERNHQREREWNRPRFPPRSSTPEIHRRHSQEFHRRLSQEFRLPSHTKALSHESVVSQGSAARPGHRHLERRGSLASLRSFDDDHSSRPSSIGSQADYRDRISELDRERNHEREREWNKRHPPSRPSSSLSTSSNHSFSHSHSHPPRSPSATPYLAPTHASLQRKSSRTSLRSDSPASLASSRDSLKEQEQEEKVEVTHERERNWNSPRPHWSTSKTPSPSHLKIRNKSLRATSSLTHLRDSDGHQDASRVPIKSRDVSSKADPSSARSSALSHKSGDRSDLGLDESAVGTTQSTSLNGFSPGRTPGSASKFGWNFSRSPLPPLELDDSAHHRRSTSSPTSDFRPSNGAPEAIMSSQIPVRSRMKSFSGVGHATSSMSLTQVVGGGSSFQRDDQNGLTEVVELHRRVEPQVARSSWSQEDVVLASDEESIIDLPPQSTTPKSNPPNTVPEEIETDAETEVLTSPSPQDSPQLRVSASFPNEVKVVDPPHSQIPNPSPEERSVNAAPPGTPPSTSTGLQLPTSGTSPSFALLTPPRQTSFGSSILDFRTPSPPHDLPDLPGPPSSSDDDALGGTPMKDQDAHAISNFTLTKTPKPPGAWAATPLPPKFGHRSPSPATFFPLESTPPTSTSTPLPRANAHLPTRTELETDNPDEDGLLTPVGTLSRARSLPLRTPALPGAWMATPGQSALLGNSVNQSQYGSLGRRKGLLKVRFDVAESEASATEGHPTPPITAIRLVNPELPLPNWSTDRGTDNSIEAVASEVTQLTLTPTIPHRPTTPERPTTPISRENGTSPRSLRKSPAVRLVDAYGRERVDEGETAELSVAPPNGYADAERKATSPATLRRSLVRIVDAMGKEVDDAVEIPDPSEGRADRSFEADVSVVSDDIPVGHAEALARMRKTLRDLAESLSDIDRSEDLELNSSHLEQLEEVSKAARLARNQLAHNLHLETAKQNDLHRNNKFPAWTRGLLPVTTKKPRNTAIIYCGVIIQLLFILMMWRYAHSEAHRLFYTTYYDSLYPEFTPIQGSSCFSGTLSTSRSWTMFDSYETIRREGWWSIRGEALRAMRYVGERAWEWWGEHAHFEKPT